MLKLLSALCAAPFLALTAWVGISNAQTPVVDPHDWKPADIIHPMRASGRVPGILVLGGAEGGDAWAKAVAGRLGDGGYAALPLAYFHVPGLQDQLQLIPIERLKQGIDRLMQDPHVDPRRIAVLGLSKGAEAALILAANDHRVRAVVAGSPSDVIWQGINRKDGSVQSSWSMSGQPLPYVPFAACTDCRSLAALYARSHEATDAVTRASIPVERIHGPILLFSSVQDAVWPSATMTESIVARLKKRHFRYPVVTNSYPDGGHFTLGPLAEDDAKSDAEFGGGSAEAILAARRDSWMKTLSFLDGTFHYRPARH